MEEKQNDNDTSIVYQAFVFLSFKCYRTKGKDQIKPFNLNVSGDNIAV